MSDSLIRSYFEALLHMRISWISHNYSAGR